MKAVTFIVLICLFLPCMVVGFLLSAMVLGLVAGAYGFYLYADKQFGKKKPS